MNIIIRTFLITAIITFVAAGILHSQSDGVKVGEVTQIDKKAGEIIVGSPTAGADIKMGDLLYVRIDGKVVHLRSTFPMMTVSKCKPEGKNRSLWTKTEKGAPVYRHREGVEDSTEIGKDVATADVKGNNYKIGDLGPAGGWIFYDKGDSSDGWRYLEAAPLDKGTEVVWGCNGKIIPGAQGKSIGTGKSNTQAIVKSCGEKKTAAKLCIDYRGGGKSDWFLPSIDELTAINENLYKKGIGGFATHSVPSCWSSSECDANGAWTQSFIFHHEFYNNKYQERYVCAIRAF